MLVKSITLDVPPKGIPWGKGIPLGKTIPMNTGRSLSIGLLRSFGAMEKLIGIFGSFITSI